MDLLVVYDVATLDYEGQRRLSRVAAVCERYGVRVQYSVFECRLAPADVERLVDELLEVIDPVEDSILLYRFDRPIRDVRRRLGRAPLADVESPWIIGSSDSADAP